jgi:hypothetical protein
VTARENRLWSKAAALRVRSAVAFGGGLVLLGAMSSTAEEEGRDGGKCPFRLDGLTAASFADALQRG